MVVLRTAGACGASTGACGIDERTVPGMSIVLLTAGEEKARAFKINEVIKKIPETERLVMRFKVKGSRFKCVHIPEIK